MPALRIVVALVVAAAIFVAVPASASRGLASLRGGWTGTTVPITVNGLARSYLLIRPQTTSTTPLPVLMELQGCCTTPAVEAQRSGFIDVTGPAILVYPAGYQQSWNAGSCCHQAQADHVDDVAFLTAVVNQVLTDQPDAATGHVYLAGYSNGGRMALRMACAAPQLFTAVASYGAVNAAPCPDPAPVSMLEAAGTADPELTMGPGGAPHSINGYAEPTVQQQVEQYRRADSCATNPATHTQGNLTSTTWTGCRSGDAVQLSLYQGGNHDWPQAGGVTPSAAQVMWAFFQTIHTSGSDPSGMTAISRRTLLAIGPLCQV
jgi:polyhydroxybutyrate depolymerase